MIDSDDANTERAYEQQFLYKGKKWNTHTHTHTHTPVAKKELFEEARIHAQSTTLKTFIHVTAGVIQRAFI